MTEKVPVGQDIHIEINGIILKRKQKTTPPYYFCCLILKHYGLLPVKVMEE